MNFESKTNLSDDKLEELTRIKINAKVSAAADSLIELYTLYDELHYDLYSALVSGLGVILTADAESKITIFPELVKLINKYIPKTKG